MIYDPIARCNRYRLFDIEKSQWDPWFSISEGTTEIALISTIGNSCWPVYPSGRRHLHERLLLDYMRRQHNFCLLARDQLRRLKIAIVSALTELMIPARLWNQRTLIWLTGIPKVIKFPILEIAFALDKSVSKIEEAVLKALEIRSSELSADIYWPNGIHLTRGGALWKD